MIHVASKRMDSHAFDLGALRTGVLQSAHRHQQTIACPNQKFSPILEIHFLDSIDIIPGATPQVGSGLLKSKHMQMFDGKRAHFYSIAGGPLGWKDRHPEWFREDLRSLLELLAGGVIKPVIAARLPLEEASHAHELIESAQIQGKLVLIPNGS